MNASDPTGKTASDFIAGVYKKLIPEGLSGNAGGDFGPGERPQLIPPPVSGLGRLTGSVIERVGGGPGAQMRFAPGVNSAAGGIATALQPFSVGMRAAGIGLQGLAGVAHGASEPLTTAADLTAKVANSKFGMENLVPDGMTPPTTGEARGLFSSLPGAYQTPAYQALTAHGSTNAPMFPDTYSPPPPTQHAELPSGADVQEWLGKTDRASATNFVSNKLGPDVAKQLAQTDGAGYRAAIFNLSSDPRFRGQLTSSPLPDAGGGGAGDITGRFEN
jgi:hypothetical protein